MIQVFSRQGFLGEAMDTSVVRNNQWKDRLARSNYLQVALSWCHSLKLYTSRGPRGTLGILACVTSGCRSERHGLELLEVVNHNMQSEVGNSDCYDSDFEHHSLRFEDLSIAPFRTLSLWRTKSRLSSTAGNSSMVRRSSQTLRHVVLQA